MFSKKIFTALLVVYSSAFLAAESNKITQHSTQSKVITTASFVRLRKKASLNSKTISTLHIGTELTVIKKSDKFYKIGNLKNYWYQVKLENGVEGWVYGAFLKKFTDSDEYLIALKIIKQRLLKKLKFEEAVDLYDWLKSLKKSLKKKYSQIAGQLDLIQIKLIYKYLKNQFEYDEKYQRDKFKSPKHEAWIKKVRPYVFYAEHGGWSLKGKITSKLQVLYHGTPIGDELTWMMVNIEQNNMERYAECGGDFFCGFSRDYSVWPSYLIQYPKGKYSNVVYNKILALLNREIKYSTFLKKADLTNKSKVEGFYSDIKHLSNQLKNIDKRKKSILLKQIRLIKRIFDCYVQNKTSNFCIQIRNRKQS